MNKLSLRTRLTVIVTVVFAAALTITAVFTRNLVESALRDDARANAEALLADYLDTLQGGAVGLADPDDAVTRFLYLAPDGGEITDADYQRLLFDAMDDLFEELAPPDLPAGPDGIFAPVVVDRGIVEIDADLVDVTGAPTTLDRGGEVIAVGVPVTIGDRSLTIAVSTPVKPVQDSLEALTLLGLIALPTLTAVIAAITWITVTRALAPVEAISNQADRISATNLDERVPQPATGREIVHLATTMNNMLERLDTASRAQRQFISDASHELRSPVTATLASLETTSAPPASSDWETLRTTLIAEQHRLGDLINDLLLLAQLDEGAAPEPEGEVDLDELALAEAERSHRAPVAVHVEEPARITGNAALLEHCVRNLVDNAARHTASRVDITITATNGHGVLTVDDDGPGVPEAERSRIFDRFSRLDDARNRADGGAGLGLAIAKRITTQHHGIIECSTSPTGGARFTITFPSSRPQHQEPRTGPGR